MGYEVWDKSKLEIGFTMEFRNYHLMVNESWLKFVNDQFKNHSLVLSDGVIWLATFLLVDLRFGLSNGACRIVGLEAHEEILFDGLVCILVL